MIYTVNNWAVNDLIDSIFVLDGSLRRGYNSHKCVFIVVGKGEAVMRLSKVLLTIMLAGLFVLLLSALVVSPDTEVEAAVPSELIGARLLPVAMPTQGADVWDIQRTMSYKAVALAILCLAAALPILNREKDANGRVLCAVRYENSFYQVFRQEVAGG